MEMPTIVKQTRNYLLIKVPLPKQERSNVVVPKNGKMTAAEKCGWRRLQEAEKDIKEGRVITAPSLKEALRRYEKRQWD